MHHLVRVNAVLCSIHNVQGRERSGQENLTQSSTKGKVGLRLHREVTNRFAATIVYGNQFCILASRGQHSWYPTFQETV